MKDKLLEGKYYELLHYVETKHPNESRHDTALRYIKEAENKNTNTGAGKEMAEIKTPDVPKEYKQMVDDITLSLQSNADKIMWAVEMLGGKAFEVETDKYEIVISKIKADKEVGG